MKRQVSWLSLYGPATGIRVALAALTMAIVACGTSSPPTASTSPTPSHPPQSLGVIVTEGHETTPPRTYFVAIVGSDGKIKAGARATQPSLFVGVPPWVSVAGSSVYYIDGDSKLMRLTVDGNPTLAATLPGAPSARVMAAVDPASGRIAFGVFAAGANASQLWLQNADGSSRRMLPGNGFPIAWHAGSIVVAPAAGNVQNRGEVNPYLAHSLQLVDSATGAISNMTAACSAPSDSIGGPLSPAGVACIHFPSSGSSRLTAIGWDGHESPLGTPVEPNTVSAVLSLDGASAAIGNNGATNSSPDLKLSRDGAFVSIHVACDPVGWFDATHLLVNTTPLQGSSNGFEVIDVTDGAIQPVDLGTNSGFVSYGPYFAALPWS